MLLAPAALSQNVGEKPVGVEMLSEKIVLFRNGAGKVVAINDVCPHRGAPLHEGAHALFLSYLSTIRGC